MKQTASGSLSHFLSIFSPLFCPSVFVFLHAQFDGRSSALHLNVSNNRASKREGNRREKAGEDGDGVKYKQTKSKKHTLIQQTQINVWGKHRDNMLVTKKTN